MMALFWIAKTIDGERRYYIQEADWPIFAMLRAAIAGFPGQPEETIELDAKTARKVPKKMIGRIAGGAEGEAIALTGSQRLNCHR